MGLGRAMKVCSCPRGPKNFDQCASVSVTLWNQCYHPFSYENNKNAVYVEGLFLKAVEFFIGTL